MKKYGRKKAFKRTFKTKGKRAVRTKKPLRKLIQSVINKNLEDKFAYKSSIDVNYNSGINSQADLVSVMPSINIGTADSSRVGAQLHGKSLLVQGHMITNLTNNSYSDVRLGIRMMIVSPKGYIGYEPAFNSATTWLNYLLKRGGSTLAFTGLVADLYSPINSDAITVHYDKTFFMTVPYAPAGVSGMVMPTGTTKFFKIYLPVKNKLLKYDAAINNGLTPTNYNPFLIVGYSHLDASIPDTVQTQVNVSFTSQFKYQDA